MRGDGVAMACQHMTKIAMMRQLKQTMMTCSDDVMERAAGAQDDAPCVRTRAARSPRAMTNENVDVRGD